MDGVTQKNYFTILYNYFNNSLAVFSKIIPIALKALQISKIGLLIRALTHKSRFNKFF